MLHLEAAPVDPSNAEQANAWDGADGRYWAANAERFDASMAGYRRPFLDAAQIKPDSRVLDIGCGTGQTTRDAARRAGAGHALGVDLSEQMIDVARMLAVLETVPNARFERADAQIHPFPAGSFDIVISRTGAMFFGRPDAAFTNIAHALRPGGRLALLCWQPAARNEWFRSFFTALTGARELPTPPPGAPGPFSLSDPTRVRSLLGPAGFVDIELESRHEPLLFGRDVDEAQSFLLGLLGWMLPATDAARLRATHDLRASLQAHRSTDGVRYDSAAWIITATRSPGNRPCHSRSTTTS
jgi:SAM-dependent methyltransferase